MIVSTVFTAVCTQFINLFTSVSLLICGSLLHSVWLPDVLPRRSYSSLRMEEWKSHRYPIFSEISTISCLSNPISGRYTGNVHTSLVAVKALHGLACHLSDTLTGNQSQASVFFCKMLCNPHHITAHDDRQFIMWAFFINIKLDIGKVDYMQLDRSCIFGNLLCKIHYLLFCPLAGVRRCMEIGCLQVRRHVWRSYNLQPDCRFHRTSRSIAVPLVPIGIPPGPGMISE